MSMGYCVFAADFILDIEENVRKLNQRLIDAAETRVSRFQDTYDIKRKLIENIQFHSQARE